MGNKEVVGPGKFVAYSYKLYNEADGSQLFEATKEQPDVMVYGISHEVVPGLIAAMKDLGKGDKFSVVLPPEAAFGQRYDENVVSLEREIFMQDGKLVAEVTVGAELPMMTQEGYRILGRVLEIGDKEIKMDFNHPFAGLTVKFDGEIEECRDATPEELQPVHSCGCGCGHDHSHGESCGSCGDGCGCGDDCGCESGSADSCGCK